MKIRAKLNLLIHDVYMTLTTSYERSICVWFRSHGAQWETSFYQKTVQK